MKTLAMIVAMLVAGCSSSDDPASDGNAGADKGIDSLLSDGPGPEQVTTIDGAPDQTPVTDMAAPDLAPPDTRPKDAGPACAGATLVQTLAVDMVICQGGVKLSQCDAAQICGGWSLCSASQYRARGGETIPADSEAWLGSCIRDGGSMTSPSESTCSSCQGVASMKTTSWECDGSDDTATSAARVGVASHATCHRVGSNSPSQQAFWIAKPSDIKLSAAVCCK